MDTTFIHTQIVSWIQGATTKIDGELRCLAATCLTSQMANCWGVSFASWDANIYKDFQPNTVFVSLYVRIDVELQLLAEQDEMEGWEIMYGELMAPTVNAKPVSAPGPGVAIMHPDFTPINFAAYELAIRLGPSSLSRALAWAIADLSDTLSGESTFMPLVAGPEVVRNPGSVCFQADQWYRAGRKEEARAHLLEYIGKVKLKLPGQ